jgi:N12 class adenine-specific DNA methylase
MSQIDDFLSGKPAGGQPSKQSEIDAFLGAPETSLARKAGDLGISLAKGVVGVPEAVVGLFDIPTGGAVGKFLENEGGAFGFRPKQAKEYLSSFQSDDLQAKQKQFQDADGVLNKAGVAISNPSLIVNAITESAPSIGAGGVVSRGLMAAGARGVSSAAGGVGPALPGVLARTVGEKAAPRVAGALGEGVVGAGSAAESIRQETQDGLLTPTQSALAAGSGLATAVFGYLGGKAAERLGIGDLETMIAKGAAGQAPREVAKSIPRQVIEGAISEGLLEELPQSVSEQVLQNLALNKPWHEGVEDAAVMGTLAGMAMGGGAAGYSGLRTENKEPPPEPPPAPTQNPEPGQPPASGPTLALPAPDPGVIQVGADGTARTPPYQVPPYVGDVTDVEPKPVNPVREQVAAAAEQGGALSAAALTAIDAGVTESVNPGYREIDFEDADPHDQAIALQFFKELDLERKVEGYLKDYAEYFAGNDDDIPDFGAPSNATTEQFLRAMGASEEEIQDAVATSRKRANAQSNPSSNVAAPAYEPADPRQSVGASASRSETQVAPRQPDNFTGTPTAAMGQPGATVSAGPGFGLKDALAQIRARKQQEASNAQAAQAAPAANAAPGAAPAAGPAPDIKAITGKLIPDMTDAELQVAIEHYGPAHKRTAKLQKEVQRRAAPAATTIPGVTNGPQAPQAQQASPQPAQAGAAPAAGPATGNASAADPTGTPEVRALTNGAQAQNTGAQAAPAAGPQGATATTQAPDLNEVGARWTRMTSLEREGALKLAGWRTNAGGLNLVGKRLLRTSWGNMVAGTQDTLARAMSTRAEVGGNPANGGSNRTQMPDEKAQNAIKLEADQIAEAVSKADRLDLKGAERAQWVAESLSGIWAMTPDEVRDVPEVAAALRKKPSKEDATAASVRAVEQVMRQAEQAAAINSEAAAPTTQSGGAEQGLTSPTRAQPGEPGYTLLDARNDLIELRTREASQGAVVDDRLLQRIREQEKLVAKMERKGSSTNAEKPLQDAQADQVPSEQAQPASAPSDSVVNVPPAIAAALDADMQAQKARVTRLRNEAAKDGTTLEEKTRAQTQIKGAEFTLQTMRRTRFDAEDAAIKAIEQKDMAPFAEHITFFKTEKALQELIGAAQAPAPAAAPKKVAPKKKPNADQTRAKADLMAALADLGDILGKNTRMNIMPEQEQKLLPVLTRVLDAAFRLGYHKFKDSAKFALDQIRTHLGDEAADALTLDHLQGAYIAMAGGKQNADTKRTVIDVESKADIEAHEAVSVDNEEAADTTAAKDNQEQSDAGTAIRRDGTEPLEGVAAQDDRGAAPGGEAEQRSTDGQQTGGSPGGKADDGGNAEARSGRNGAPGADSVETGARNRGGRGGVTGSSTAKARRSTRPTAQELQDEAAEEIKQASPVNVPGIDFTITDEVGLGKGSESVKFADNLAAIRTLKLIEQENRRATPEEQRTLARYVGWGGLKNAFRVAGAKDTEGVAKGWEARVAEVEALLTPAELRAARNSTTAAHYTSQSVVQAVWKAVERLGFRGGAVLEPSVGTGNFLGLMPAALRGNSKTLAVEYDSLTARIAQQLYPNQSILHSGFQDVPLPDNKFALAIGNPPFGREGLYFRHNPAINGKSIHNQFFLQSVQSLDADGLMGMVVSHYLMDAMDYSNRLDMAVQAEFLGAVRLPDTAFKENARTEVVTDIVLFRKRSKTDREYANKAAQLLRNEGMKRAEILEGYSADAVDKVDAILGEMNRWVLSSKQANFAGSGEAINVNPYFLSNTGHVVGTMDASGTMNNRAGLNVRLEDPSTFVQRLNQAIESLPTRAPVDAVAQRTMAQFEQMATGMRLAINRAEPGAVTRTAEGQLKVVVEMDDPNQSRKTILDEIVLTADIPFSEEYSLRTDGKWQREEDVIGVDGKPVKKAKKDGSPSNFNEKKIAVYDNLSAIPNKDKWGKDRIAIITDMLPVRDAIKRQLVLESSDAPTAMIEANRKRMNDAYANFKKNHGQLHKSSTINVAMTMPDGALALSIEEVAKDGTISLAAIMQRRVTTPPKPVESVKSASEAVAVVLAESGQIDIERVAKLLGTDIAGAEAALSEGDNPRAFFDPETGRWEAADGYLSGLVRRKLLAAKASGLEKNVAALEKVQPEQWDATQITPNIGSAWIPGEVYAGFLKHLGFSSSGVIYTQATNTFSVAVKGSAKPEWTPSQNALPTSEIVERTLNSKPVKVIHKDNEGKTHVDEEGTLESQMKATEIANEFLDWAFSDDARRDQLVEIFNEKFNTRVVRQRDGSLLTLPGKVPDTVIKMRPWQLNAVWRGITDRAVLYDHAVGAGKTYTAIARAMERRRMGLSKKPMIVVPNHLVEQWAADVKKLYPGANVLAAGKKDFEKMRRRRLFARIGSGDYDMVIVGHSSFGFIDIDPATEQRYLDEELRIAYAAVKEAEEAAAESGFSGWGKPMGVAEAERLVKKLEERLAKVRDSKRDRLLTFEEMGIDDLTIDEAHEFKNLAYSSNLQGTAGMGNKAGSAKAMDLSLKLRSLNERPGTSVAFLTGTPISNSVAEMYLVLKNLVPNELRDLGMENFDAWRTTFVSASSAYEPTESGSLKEVTRLGREWMNMKSLMDLYYSVADAVTLQDMKDDFARANPGKSFPVPKVRSQIAGDGDRAMVAVKPNAAQRTILRDIVSGFEGLPGIKSRKERNAERLRLMDRARKVSLDARAVDP